MRTLKILVVVMGIMLVAGVAILIVTIAGRVPRSGPGPATSLPFIAPPIDLPQGASVVAIVRGERVIMAHHDTRIEAEDHVIIFLSDRRHIDAVSRLFQSDA